MTESNEGGVRVERTVRQPMTCEHDISIHQDCDDCTAKYNSEEQCWETKQMRRELASVDLRVTGLMRERSAEYRRRRQAEAELERYRKALEAWKWMMANNAYDMGELISEFDKIVTNTLGDA